ncbi:MAG: hypothetical protein ACM3NS_05460 [Deltaproteobacteria bacterium]
MKQPTPDRHLVAVWNPSYVADAMDEHRGMLLGLINAHPKDERPLEDAYVWWGRIRSGHRRTPLTHLEQVLALGDGLETPGAEVHLYLTDYRSLYVGEVLEITDEDVRDDTGHVPAYYGAHQCDCWFRLGDLRQLVQDDTVQVIAELAKLRNTAYHDQPVSIYGGMVNLPLIVTRDDGARFFATEEREALLEGRYWAEEDAQRAGLGPVERDLRQNLFGEPAWDALDPTVRGFIASAEHLFRTSRGTPGFDFSGVLLGLAKACEVQAGIAVRAGLKGAPEAERRANIDGTVCDLGAALAVSLGALGRAISKEAAMHRRLEQRLADGAWLVNQFAYVLEDLARYRNPAAHREPVGLEDAARLRAQLLGIGCYGDLVRLAGVRAK